MTMHDIVFCIIIAGGDAYCSRTRLLRLAPPTRPSDERPPVMYGHFCLVPRVSVHDRYYCISHTFVLRLAGSFGAVFVDQSFWQSSIAAKPSHGVGGLLAGGLAWLAIPFCAAFAFGMSYWTMALKAGQHIEPEKESLSGQWIIVLYIAIV